MDVKYHKMQVKYLLNHGMVQLAIDKYFIPQPILPTYTDEQREVHEYLITKLKQFIHKANTGEWKYE